MRVLCYTFTGKKLPDFIPYFFDDTIHEKSRIFNIIDYIKVNTEQDIKNDLINRKCDDYFNEIYVILENKIRLNSFTKPLNEYTYCSFEDLCSLLSMSNLSSLDVDQQIDNYIQHDTIYYIRK